MTLLIGGLLAGCASPGSPHPPSLGLPEPVNDLRAERVGDAVTLRWTTPAETTDHLQLRGPVMAVICRDRPSTAATPPCTAVQTLTAQPGAQTATDTLPATLLHDPVQALQYRLLLRNASGRDAGPSAAALAASGATPPAVLGLLARSVPGGVALAWAAHDSGPDSSVQLVREPAGQGGALPRTGSVAPKHKGASAPGVPTSLRSPGQTEAAPVRLLAVPPGTPDRGGALDPTAARDRIYTYRALRLRTLEVDGSRLTLRSADSAPVTVRVEDVAAPPTPTGLVLAAAGLAADLSWQPEFAPDLAGYVVYRTELPASGPPTPEEGKGGWQRVTSAPVALPAFHDTLPHAGRFLYRISAVDRSGNESQPSAPATAEATAADQ